MQCSARKNALGWHTILFLFIAMRKIQNNQSIIKINTADAIFKQLLLVVVFDFFFRHTCGTKIASIDHSGNFKNNVVLSHICEVI